MISTFENIDDSFKKKRHEGLGDIQPKFWFQEINGETVMLVKRQHKERVEGQKEKSKMFNHFGEYFGYKLAQKAGIEACPVKLVTLHDYKNQYVNYRDPEIKKHFYTACGSVRVLEPYQDMVHGENIISRFRNKYKEKYKEITKLNNVYSDIAEDNIDIILNSIITETYNYERSCARRNEKQIKQDIATNMNDMVSMVVYDCIFGNNDRHSQNWAMYFDNKNGTLKLYPAYDNERVLGLSIPEAKMKRIVQNENYDDNLLTSRMGMTPKHGTVNYKSMLSYLTEKYPECAIPAIKKITKNVKLKDIEDLYDSVKGITERSQDCEELKDADELPEEYKTFGIKLFLDRSEFAKDLVRKHEEKSKIKTIKKSEDESLTK